MDEDAELTAEEILTFGPVVEAQVWTPVFLAEQRAPIAQAAGRPKFGPVFNSEGLGKAVLIRPCVSRGKRIRGLPPIYTPTMLEAHATVFAGWPMYLDHAPPALTEAAAKRGRSVKELGGQVVTPFWDAAFTQEYDAEFGYQKGGVLAEIWASPFLRNLVGENPNLLHTSIAAWPTAGKPKQVPWNTKVRGMAIEGIRRQPQGSVDFVPRGGAGGRLLPLTEGEQDPDLVPWPEPRWEEQDVSLVVSLAESFYSAEAVDGNGNIPDFGQMQPDALRSWVQENAPHLLPALRESSAEPTPSASSPPSTTPATGVTVEDVRRIVQEAQQSAPSVEEFEQTVQEALDERDAQRALSAEAHRLIEAAEGLPVSWKADLKARYSMLPSGPSPALLVESDTDDEGNELSELDVLKKNVEEDLQHARDLIAEATGKPRVRGEGGGTSKSSGDERTVRESKERTPYWRERFAEMGIVESADDALAVHGVEKEKVEA